MTEEEKAYLHWLYQAVGMGGQRALQKMGKIGSAKDIYRLLKEKKLEEAMGSEYQKRTAQMEEFSREYDVLKEYGEMRRRGISVVFQGEADYPDKLSAIPGAPYGLYYVGKLPSKGQKSVAVIGARRCSEYGRCMARQFGTELAEAGIQVISGMARGIDGISQSAAIAGNGYSIGVLGCGVDICYPKENRGLYEDLIKKGGICSEYPPGTQPRALLFPPRNRIISGLADAVLVIEAKEKSGTLITVDMALEQGREVYALPGRLTDPLSRGCNQLIRQGAGMITSVRELLQELIGNYESENTVRQEKLVFLEGLQKELLETLDFAPKSAETLQYELIRNYGTETSFPEIFHGLLQLCADGYAKQIGGCYFMKSGEN